MPNPRCPLTIEELRLIQKELKRGEWHDDPDSFEPSYCASCGMDHPRHALECSWFKAFGLVSRAIGVMTEREREEGRFMTIGKEAPPWFLALKGEAWRYDDAGLLQVRINGEWQHPETGQRITEEEMLAAETKKETE